LYPIQILLDEHKLVERVIKLVEKVRSKLKKKKEIPAPTFWKLVEFIQSYADVIHHSKEEDILFMHMREHEAELSDKVWDQIGVLIDEHIQGLDLANEMHKAIREYQRGSISARRRILRAVNTYVDMMKAHFKSEEDDVFPAMIKVLSKSEKDKMAADFKRFDKLVGGTAAHRRYQKIVDELEQELR
jgi:hemerythrin-like domain-containing protein